MSGAQDNGDWGLLPADVKAHFQSLEWHNEKNLRNRLNGTREVAMKIGLKSPTGKQALADLPRLQRFIDSWLRWPDQSRIRYETRSFHQLGPTRLPVQFTLDNFQQLMDTLGRSAKARVDHWHTVMQPFLDRERALYRPLVSHLGWLDKLNVEDAQLLVDLMHQLHAGMGRGQYLRALPLKGIHTKFIETHEMPLNDLLDVLHNGELSVAGGLRGWLQCIDNPRNWVLIRPLGDTTREALGGLPVLQIDTATLRKHRLPARRIVIVENDQSGLALPALANTIAVISGGNNLSWLQHNDWIADCEIRYWGDIDSWGFRFLDTARALQPHIQSVMMDRRTVDLFAARMGREAESNWLPLTHLTDAENSLFVDLSRDRFAGNRLEQEKLPPDYITGCLADWVQ